MPFPHHQPNWFAGLGAGLVALVFGAVLWNLPARSAQSVPGAAIPPPELQLQSTVDGQPAEAVLAGGCFWGMELVFSHVEGVVDVVSGYAGGDKAHANYADSSSGLYDDAEAVRIAYDPAQVSYGELLQIYFSVAHDPTQLNRQGPDVGPQYRSEIFAANADQAQVARAYIEQLDSAQVFDQPIATRVSVGESFFPAEAYHQDYAKLHPDSLYIRYHDLPKLRALKARHPRHYAADYAGGN